ncbi:UPF0489 protein C5orf22 homolog isoform X2 [Halichondria panicea]|uniref:UPF0489 protein C5orf22 homolog isoform X2 n=1 Tax=Halichondria panicea TaxID=6063 RepID=UPI00312B74B6
MQQDPDPSTCSSQHRGSLPVAIVEDHDEALPLLYRAIGSRRLPFNSITLVHFDAHPDLLSPNIKADRLTHTAELFSSTSIADWILPTLYSGHVGGVVWLKPPWAEQIPDGEYCLIVGKDKSSGHVRLATPLSYFISEMLCVPRSQLDNVREIPLLVTTVTIPSATDMMPPQPKRRRLLPEKGIGRLLKESKGWVLDFDLDFFSTGNPYRGPFTSEQYHLLQRLYRTPQIPEGDKSEGALQEVVEKRRKQLDLLNGLWSDNYPQREIIEQLDMSPPQQRLVEGIRTFLRQSADIDQEYIHTCGLLTELPLHVSSEGEIAALMKESFQLLEELVACAGSPALVTIARSSVDHYTPAHQVDPIQEQLITSLQTLCAGHKLNIICN